MHYVYILKSRPLCNRHLNACESRPVLRADACDAKLRYYVGSTSNLKRRLAEHNRGDSTYTAQYSSWELINYFAFVTKDKAVAFERYLKSGAGRRFQIRHFGD